MGICHHVLFSGGYGRQRHFRGGFRTGGYGRHRRQWVKIFYIRVCLDLIDKVIRVATHLFSTLLNSQSNTLILFSSSLRMSTFNSVNRLRKPGRLPTSSYRSTVLVINNRAGYSLGLIKAV